jgi:hypothetical protein
MEGWTNQEHQCAFIGGVATYGVDIFSKSFAWKYDQMDGHLVIEAFCLS